MKKLKRFVITTLLLPGCYGVSLALWSLLQPFQSVPEGSFYFLVGMGSYFAFQWVFFRPIRTYVFGHELTHALAAWMTGAKVKHFRVSKNGGSVMVSKTNFFVALAPYMIPLYALLLVGFFAVVDYFVPVKPYWRFCLWILGASIGFHMALTVYALKEGQPDLKTAGKYLSVLIIYLGNVVSIAFLLGVLFPHTVSWNRFMRVSGRQTVAALRHVGRGSVIAWNGAVHGLEHRD
ncbi:MAG: M50 family metallopeptidase [Elusimicrobiota bacterium]